MYVYMSMNVQGGWIILKGLCSCCCNSAWLPVAKTPINTVLLSGLEMA